MPSSAQILENGEIITFKIDGKFYSDSYLCEGPYEDVGNAIIEVNFLCSDKIFFSYTREKDVLVLRKDFGFEGGYDEYSNITSE